jgi:hypothetical protein
MFTIAFIAEPLQGYGGIYPLDDGYLKSAFELTRKYGGICIADEVNAVIECASQLCDLTRNRCKLASVAQATRSGASRRATTSAPCPT